MYPLTTGTGYPLKISSLRSVVHSPYVISPVTKLTLASRVNLIVSVRVSVTSFPLRSTYLIVRVADFSVTISFTVFGHTGLFGSLGNTGLPGSGVDGVTGVPSGFFGKFGSFGSTGLPGVTGIILSATVTLKI